MKKIFIITIIAIIFPFTAHSQDTSVKAIDSDAMLKTPTGNLYGNLCMPSNKDTCTLAIFISGSGPTDRNSNNPYMKNNALKKLAHALAENGIASLRYDKRGIAESKSAGKEEADLRFDMYVDDLKAWITQMRLDKRFKKIVLLGHSEGALIGMLAANEADGYVSMAGAGRSADSLIQIQLNTQHADFKNKAYAMLDTLRSGKHIVNPDKDMMSLFRPSIQDYLMSWMKYNPQTEIKKLKVPVLIVQGNKDLQVSVEDSELLYRAKPDARYKIINNMNHVLFLVEGDDVSDNYAAYSNSKLPVAEDLVKEISEFILSL
jgi:pimeloyl-ACP methyl ester carboxylesterase